MKQSTSVKSIVVLAVICLVISAALAIVNSFTAPVIETAKQERENASRQAVLPAADKFLPLSVSTPESITDAYQGVDTAGNTVGYVFTAQGKGFGGTITVMCAIDPQGLIVNAATIDVTSETTTLGGQTANERYTSQYAGKDAALEGVDAISHATITSTAYEACVRDCFSAFDAVKEG